MDSEQQQDQSSTYTLSEKITQLGKVNEVKIFEIKQLSRKTEATDKVLTKKQEDIEKSEDQPNTVEDNTSDEEDSKTDDYRNPTINENILQVSSYEESRKRVIDEPNSSDKDSDEHVSDIKETEILESDEVQNKPLLKTEMTISASHNGEPAKKAIAYFCKVYYEQKTMLEWQVMFVVVRNLHALQQYIKKHHPHAVELQAVSLMLKSQTDVEFDIQKHHHEIPHGWEIKPRRLPLLLRYTSIEKFGRGTYLEPPTCVIDVYADDKKETAKRLHYRVPVLGVEEYIEIFINLSLTYNDTTKFESAAAFRDPELSGKVEEVKRIIQDVLTKRYSALDDLLKTSMTSFAADMYSCGLISEVTKDTTNFNEMMREFKSGMNFIRDGHKLVKRCQLFLQSLVKQGGPHIDAAITIAEEWTANIKEKLNINIEFDIDVIRPISHAKADVIKLIRVIRNVLTKQYTSLYELTRSDLQLLADKMHAACLISSYAQSSHSFDVIIDDFQEQLSLMMSVSKIEQHCNKFLSILTDMGGSCALVSQTLQQDWIKDSRAECGVELQLDYSDLFNKARKEGYVKIKWTKLSISGPSGSGKSSFMKLLLDKPAPVNHDSTPVTTVPEVRIVTIMVDGKGSSTQSWNEVSLKSLKMMIVKAIKKGVKTQLSGTDKGQEISSFIKNAPGPASNVSKDIPLKLSSTKEVKAISHPPVSNVTKDILEMLPHVEGSTELFQSHWIYAVDSGGQGAFLDISPTLLRYNSVNIFTHKLNVKLDDKVKFYYSIDGKQIGNPMERQVTNRQLLEASFRSLTSVLPPTLPSNIPCSLKDPLCLVVGTFYDKSGNCTESLDDKNAILWSSLKRYEEITYVYRTVGEKIIHPLNAISKGDDEKKLADKIRQKISQSYVEADIPIRWFLFRLELEMSKKTSENVISKSDCIEIGNVFDMNEDDVVAALKYYHDLTIYLYFPEVLPNVVFLNPQPLLNTLSKLISISFADVVDSLDQNINIPPGTHQKLKKKGFFSFDLLTSHFLSQCFSDTFSAENFLKLMEFLFIISPLLEQGEYFIPCVLPTTNKLESIQQPFTENIDPLVLTWNEKPIPQGLFPALVVSILSRKSSPIFSLSAPQADKPQYRNVICLSCTCLGGAVLLVDDIHWLKIFYSGPPSECYNIRQVIKEGINAVADKFNYICNLKYPKEQLLCSICKTREHLCSLNEKKRKVTCCYNIHKTDDPDKERQLPWFTSQVEGSILHSEPDVYDLLNLLVDIKHKWYEIGLVLRVPAAELESLLQQEHLPNKVKLFKVLNCWINQRTTAVTWNSIITAVKREKETRIAQKIEAYVLQDDISDYNTSSGHIKGPGKETPYNRIVLLEDACISSRVSVKKQKSDNRTKKRKRHQSDEINSDHLEPGDVLHMKRRCHYGYTLSDNDSYSYDTYSSRHRRKRPRRSHKKKIKHKRRDQKKHKGHKRQRSEDRDPNHSSRHSSSHKRRAHSKRSYHDY